MIKISLVLILVIGVLLLIVFFSAYLTQEKIVVFKCSPEFWKNNLELWKIVGVDYNSDFDETFGRDYFEPNITLKEAINKKGIGIDHIANSGTAAYLSALIDPTIDEETVRKAVNFGYIHQIDNYISNCNEMEVKVSDPILDLQKLF